MRCVRAGETNEGAKNAQLLSERILLRVLGDLHVLVEGTLNLFDGKIHLLGDLFDRIEAFHES